MGRVQREKLGYALEVATRVSLPRAEDLTPFIPTEITQGNPLDTVDLIPSEVDALEAIELPDSEQPEKFWAVCVF